MKAIKVTYYITFGLCTLWAIASWVDVIINNSNPNGSLNAWNLFQLLMEVSV